MPPPAKPPNKLYEQLLDFFASAIFQMPVLNFIDQNCMIFCSEDDDNAEYREVHLQYKALVSALIGAFCDDVKMKYDDFITALSDFSDRAKGFEGTALKAVYEQVLAAENYNLFVNLMLRHNVELQQQCLLLVLRDIGNLPPSVIAAATGASVETLQALVASAQQGAVATAPTSKKATGSASVPSPADQELAILMAVLKDSSINDQPGTSVAPTSSHSQKEKPIKPLSSSPAAAQPPAPTTSSGNSTPKSPGGLGPLPPVSSKSSSGSSGSATVENVVDLVDKMAGKKAGYDKKVEEEQSESPLSEGSPPISCVPDIVKCSPELRKVDNRGDGKVTVEEQKGEPLPSKVDSPVVLNALPSIETKTTMISDLPKKLPAMLGEAGPSNAPTGSSGSGSLPPLPGAGSSKPVTSKPVGEEQASMAALSAMFQPLGSDTAAPSSEIGDSTAAMLKNPATQRALEALKSMNADDLVARSEYLKSQRDRLISLKQQQRKTVLNEETKKQGSSRPKSARVSKQFVDDEKPQQAAASNLSPEDEERLRIRRAIGDSIKRELMASKDK